MYTHILTKFETFSSPTSNLSSTIKNSGGVLDCEDPNKGYWYSVDYEWTENGWWRYCTFNNDLVLMMFYDTGARQIVPHCHTEYAHNAFGVMLAPDVNNDFQISWIRKMALTFSDKVTLADAEYTHIMVPIITNLFSKL